MSLEVSLLRFVMNNRLTAGYWAARRGLRGCRMFRTFLKWRPRRRPGQVFTTTGLENRVWLHAAWLPASSILWLSTARITNHDRLSGIDVRCVPTNPQSHANVLTRSCNRTVFFFFLFRSLSFLSRALTLTYLLRSIAWLLAVSAWEIAMRIVANAAINLKRKRNCRRARSSVTDERVSQWFGEIHDDWRWSVLAFPLCVGINVLDVKKKKKRVYKM